MTNTPLSPLQITQPFGGRYLPGDGHALPTAAVSATSDPQNADRLPRDHRSRPAHRHKNQPRAHPSTAVAVAFPCELRKRGARTDGSLFLRRSAEPRARASVNDFAAQKTAF